MVKQRARALWESPRFADVRAYYLPAAALYQKRRQDNGQADAMEKAWVSTLSTGRFLPGRSGCRRRRAKGEDNADT